MTALNPEMHGPTQVETGAVSTETARATEFLQAALHVGKIALGIAAAMYVGHRLGVFPTTGPNP